MSSSTIQAIQQGDRKQLARAISLVENETDGFEKLLQSLPTKTDTSPGSSFVRPLRNQFRVAPAILASRSLIIDITQ